ncbi:MAG: FHA domain-containing protein [Bacteriovoracaceae bacterium]|nr:FHA domain-containing protein [Bacteriovoracaceae bacterium]
MRLSIYKNGNKQTDLDLTDEVKNIKDYKVSFYIGRSPECHVILDDKQISREHAEISFYNSQWKIEKIATFATLLVNGNTITSKELAAGDIISVGPYTIYVMLEQVFAQKKTNESEETQTTTTKEEQAGEGDESLQDDSESEVEGEPGSDAEGESDIGGDNESDADSDEQDQSFDSESSSDDDSQVGGDEFSSDQEGSASEFQMDDSGEDTSDEYPVDTFDDSDGGTQIVQFFSRYTLELFGEYAPYDSFTIEDQDVVIGRDADKCQIILNDPEVSSTHAVIKKAKGAVSITDLQSANGTLLNGVRVNSSEIINEDEFIIGSTTFTVRITSDLISSEEERLMPVEENQIVEVEEVVEVSGAFEEGMEGEDGSTGAEVKPGEKTSILKDPVKRKKLIYGLVGLAVLWLVMGDDEGGKKQTGKKGKPKKSRLLNNIDPNSTKMAKLKKKLTPEQIEFLESHYQVAKSHFESGKYNNAIYEFELMFPVDKEYKHSKDMYELAKHGVARLEEIERKKQEELERKQRADKIKTLVERATKAAKERNMALAEGLFSKILEMDPENFEVPLLRNELQAWQKEQEKIAREKAAKEAERKRKEAMLIPSRKYFLRKEWYNAIIKLDEFLQIKEMDEDLTKQGIEMLKDSKKELEAVVAPMLGKARSLREGRDLKGAYENYLEILNHDPSNSESLASMGEIKRTLKNRAKKVYREAIISESLSLFEDAKEKLQEVKQISPSDGEYYRKADEKLKDYLD